MKIQRIQTDCIKDEGKDGGKQKKKKKQNHKTRVLDKSSGRGDHSLRLIA